MAESHAFIVICANLSICVPGRHEQSSGRAGVRTTIAQRSRILAGAALGLRPGKHADWMLDGNFSADVTCHAFNTSRTPAAILLRSGKT